MLCKLIFLFAIWNPCKKHFNTFENLCEIKVFLASLPPVPPFRLVYWEAHVLHPEVVCPPKAEPELREGSHDLDVGDGGGLHMAGDEHLIDWGEELLQEGEARAREVGHLGRTKHIILLKFKKETAFCKSITHTRLERIFIAKTKQKTLHFLAKKPIKSLEHWPTLMNRCVYCSLSLLHCSLRVDWSSLLYWGSEILLWTYRPWMCMKAQGSEMTLTLGTRESIWPTRVEPQRAVMLSKVTRRS